MLAVLAAAVAAFLVACGFPSEAPGRTSVSIRGAKFLVDGRVTYPGRPVEGMLLNSRMVQAVFDDENPATRRLWRYPDTGRWHPDRNTGEFVAALPLYAAHGLRAVTIGLQGGLPQPGAAFQSWHVSAFRADGSLKPAWLARLDRAIRACDTHGIAVILSLFYFGQDSRLASEGAVLRGTDAVTDWLLARGYRNVLVEINNETSTRGYTFPILRPARVHELVVRVRRRSRGRLDVGTSFAPGVAGGTAPTDAVIRSSDYVLVHGNGLDPSGLRSLVRRVRSRPAYRAAPKPIVVNEDSTALPSFEAAVAAGASWGYYDQGLGNYRDGYQSLPINWGMNTPEKRAFFDRVLELAGGPNRRTISGR